MNSKQLIRAMGIGLLVGLLIYVVLKIFGFEINSSMIGAITGGVVGAFGSNSFVKQKP